jgi:nondiscriminating glutamyl-tRNA synthetase
MNGYLPEAINNYIAFLGWSSPDGREVIPMNEMIKLFTLERVNSSPAVFDAVKLKWMNSVYLRALDHKELWRRLLPFLEADGQKFQDASPEWIDHAVGALKTSFETLVEGVAAFRPLSSSAFELGAEAEEVFKWPTTKLVIGEWLKQLESMPTGFMTENEFNDIQKKIQTQCSVKGKEFFQALRVAIVGKPHGTELKSLVTLLPLKNLADRARTALKRAQST